jgi:hypothetical protein
MKHKNEKEKKKRKENIRTSSVSDLEVVLDKV